MSPTPRPEFASLRQAAICADLGLTIIDPRFEFLEGYPTAIDRLEENPALSPEQRNAIENGKRAVLRAVMLGKLATMGRPVNYERACRIQQVLQKLPLGDILELDALRHPLVPVPPEFWQPDVIGWDRSAAGTFERFPINAITAYMDVRIARTAVGRLWSPAVTTLQPGRQTSKSGPGRKPQHDRVAFLHLALQQAAADDLPPRQADFVRTMQELLAVAWGEDRAPGEIWIKIRFHKSTRHASPARRHGSCSCSASPERPAAPSA
ncbi:MAG TPA: hypothetical protein PKA13_20785 [Geminicoccaceae bacterium]|nr:hypothetical protein [Geminicoccus sp.]HMU52227.1 hypothetical protein [Geminicoccaceae bacterium]